MESNHKLKLRDKIKEIYQSVLEFLSKELKNDYRQDVEKYSQSSREGLTTPPKHSEIDGDKMHTFKSSSKVSVLFNQQNVTHKSDSNLYKVLKVPLRIWKEDRGVRNVGYWKTAIIRDVSLMEKLVTSNPGGLQELINENNGEIISYYITQSFPPHESLEGVYSNFHTRLSLSQSPMTKEIHGILGC